MIKQHKYRVKAAVHSKLDCSRRKQQTCRSVCSQCTLFLFICISICLEQNICSFSITYLYSATSGLYMRLCPRNTASRIYSNRGIDFFPKSTVTSRYCQLQVENEPLRKKKRSLPVCLSLFWQNHSICSWLALQYRAWIGDLRHPSESQKPNKWIFD